MQLKALHPLDATAPPSSFTRAKIRTYPKVKCPVEFAANVH